MDWLAALTHLRATSVPAVLVTVLSVRGHAPREAGAKMVVTAEQTWGSVGGGNLEASVIDRAVEMVAEGAGRPEQMEFSLNEHVENVHGTQCCGGEVVVLLEPFGARRAVAVFGMGHVGIELARILARLPISLHLVDSRTEMVAEERLAGVVGAATVHAHHAPAPETVLRSLPAGAHVVIMSHDHSEDLFLCEAAITRGDLGGIGLIGSRAKWTRFRKRLREAGHDDAAIDRIHSPIGIPGITGKEPEVIAISAAAALVRAMQDDEAVAPEAGGPSPNDVATLPAVWAGASALPQG